MLSFLNPQMRTFIDVKERSYANGNGRFVYHLDRTLTVMGDVFRPPSQSGMAYRPVFDQRW
jgi:hypothetical protein